MGHPTVWAKRAQGNNLTLLQLFGMGPKWTVVCGNCDLTFVTRLPLIDHPTVKCTDCGAINRIGIVWGGDSDEDHDE